MNNTSPAVVTASAERNRREVPRRPPVGVGLVEVMGEMVIGCSCRVPVESVMTNTQTTHPADAVRLACESSVNRCPTRSEDVHRKLTDSIVSMVDMSHAALVTADLLAITVLVFGLYFPRYRRRDMVVAILGLNVGVMAVATALSTAEVSAGLGLGLFGVLSIIRLRSSELAQEDIAYYFTALAIGLLGGISVSPGWVTPALMGAIS